MGHKLDSLSKDLVNLIQRKPSAAPLTNVARHSSPDNPIGCGCVDAVQLHKGLQPCSVERRHPGNRQSPGQRKENITFRTESYKLKPGR